jgi:hypothetical protein
MDSRDKLLDIPMILEAIQSHFIHENEKDVLLPQLTMALDFEIFPTAAKNPDTKTTAFLDEVMMKAVDTFVDSFKVRWQNKILCELGLRRVLYHCREDLPEALKNEKGCDDCFTRGLCRTVMRHIVKSLCDKEDTESLREFILKYEDGDDDE